MSSIDDQLDEWIKQGLALGMNFVDVVDVYTSDEDKPSLVVIFAQDEQAFNEFKASLGNDHDD